MRQDLYPILEFDETKDSVINPDYICDKISPIPTKLIICFFHEVIDDLLKKGDITLHATVKGENSYSIYLFKNHPVAIIGGIVGAPANGAQLEECIALGAKEVMFAGGGGILDSQHAVGKLIVVDSAIRDEGMSYHYLAPSREVLTNPDMVRKIIPVLENSGADFLVGKTWTTDAFFRETIDRVKQRKAEGAVIVEMEQAALIAIAQFRNIDYGAIIYSGDDVSSHTHDSRNWRQREDVRFNLVDLCKTVLLNKKSA